MKTRTLVLATAIAGLLGGIAGAWLFLTFHAVSFRPGPAAPLFHTPHNHAEYEASLRRVSSRVEELTGSLEALLVDLRSAVRSHAERPKPEGDLVMEFGEPDPIDLAELRAIGTLRNLTSAQAMLQCSGEVDCDEDGIGEYGTFQELSAAVGLRKGIDQGEIAGSDFSQRGNSVAPPLLRPEFQKVDAEGRVEKDGYYFQLFLPDTQEVSGFVHEVPGPGLSGGSGRIRIDMAETTWCCYAWPVVPGESGRRAFFVNQAGDVCQSSNERARHGGSASLDPLSAFRGAGITSQIAIGTSGHDGDIWIVTN